MLNLFKPFLGAVGTQTIGTNPVTIEALDPLNATASSDGNVKVVFFAFDDSPITGTVSADPYAYFGMMSWNGMAANERSITVNLCRYVDNESVAYWSNNNDMGGWHYRLIYLIRGVSR